MLPVSYWFHAAIGFEKSMKYLSLCLVFVVIAGCSNRGAYEGIQASNRNECLKVPESEYDECMENASKSYNEYERERKEALGY